MLLINVSLVIEHLGRTHLCLAVISALLPLTSINHKEFQADAPLFAGTEHLLGARRCAANIAFAPVTLEAAPAICNQSHFKVKGMTRQGL